MNIDKPSSEKKRDHLFRPGNQFGKIPQKNGKKFRWSKILSFHSEQDQIDFLKLIREKALAGDADAMKIWIDKVTPRMMSNAPELPEQVVDSFADKDARKQAAVDLVQGYLRGEVDYESAIEAFRIIRDYQETTVVPEVEADIVAIKQNMQAKDS